MNEEKMENCNLFRFDFFLIFHFYSRNISMSSLCAVFADWIPFLLVFFCSFAEIEFQDCSFSFRFWCQCSSNEQKHGHIIDGGRSKIDSISWSFFESIDNQNTRWNRKTNKILLKSTIKKKSRNRRREQDNEKERKTKIEFYTRVSKLTQSILSFSARFSFRLFRTFTEHTNKTAYYLLISFVVFARRSFASAIPWNFVVVARSTNEISKMFIVFILLCMCRLYFA